jgi:hypothetical protein
VRAAGGRPDGHAPQGHRKAVVGRRGVCGASAGGGHGGVEADGGGAGAWRRSNGADARADPSRSAVTPRDDALHRTVRPQGNGIGHSLSALVG